jgi:hypothetical protein
MNITINIPENSVDNAVVQGKKITVYFPVQETTIVTVLEKGVLFGIQGAQGIQGIQGDQGAQGIQGIPGIGIAAGGSIGQVLKKASATDYDTTWLTLDKTAVGLSNVDNTSDANKPISTATQTALNGKQATISLTTTGNSGASTFAANVLNIPTYTLSGLGGQPLATNLTSISALTYASTSFVKMTAAGTFALDTNTYLTAESDTLASVTGRGNTTTNSITVGGLTVATNLIYTDTVNGRVGIKRTNPGVELDVTGDIRVSSAIFSTSTQTNNLQTNGSNLSFKSAGTTYATMFLSTGNFVFQNGGTFTDAGFRLDVVGTARVQGNLTLTSGNAFVNAGNNVNLRSNLAGGSGYVVDAESFNNLTGTNTEQGLADFSGTYAPTSASGTPSFNALKLNFTINQTGGANGITRALYIQPTLTAAADFRAIEIANGITILGASTTAKASLRIPSGTAPTSPVDGDIWYDGTNIKMRIGAVTKTFTLL